MLKVIIYTDGSCLRNPGPGGWAAVLRSVTEGGTHKLVVRGRCADATNSEMELTAVVEALKSLRKPSEVIIRSDSEYVIKGATEWMTNWIKNGWRTSNKTPVQNREHWEAIREFMTRHRIRFEKIRAHAGNPFNEEVDCLARKAVLDKRLPEDHAELIRYATA